jgi:hypothetical protein
MPHPVLLHRDEEIKHTTQQGAWGQKINEHERGREKIKINKSN